jgi:hypothetical protein
MLVYRLQGKLELLINTSEEEETDDEPKRKMIKSGNKQTFEKMQVKEREKKDKVVTKNLRI